MKLRFKYILPTFIILGLIGFGGNGFNFSSNVKYHKETEWLRTNNLIKKDSKCFYYHFYLNHVAEPLNVKPWSSDYILYFNQKVRIKLISQTKKLCKRDPINLMINKSYTPRKSIENHHIS